MKYPVTSKIVKSKTLTSYLNDNNIALFDMDGSLFGYDEAMLKSLSAMRAPCEPKIPSNLHDLERAAHYHARMEAIKSVPGWWKNLEPIKNGFKIFNLAYKLGFNCQILTKGPRTKSIAWSEKLECCQEYFGEDILVHVVSDKGGFYGKVLFDDYPEYMSKWLKYRPRGLGIMPVNKNNKKFKHPNVIMWDGTNYKQVQNALKYVLKRQSGESLKI